MFIAEYSKSCKATCRVCKDKIPKGVLRMGKIVLMELKHSRNGVSMDLPVWFHYECFWGATYMEFPGDKERTWGNFRGIPSLTAADQDKLHLQIKGQPMAKKDVEKLVEDKENAEKEAVYTDSDPQVIIATMLEKYLIQAKVKDLNLIFSTYDIDKQKKKKKADMINLIMDQSLSKIPGVAYSCIDKTMTANDLKTTLKNMKLKTTGTKPKLIWRLLESQDVKEPSEAFVLPSDLEKRMQKLELKEMRAGDYDDYDGGYSGYGHGSYW